MVFWPEDAGGGEQSRCEEHSVPAGDKGETCQRLNSSELTHRSASHSHTNSLTYVCTQIVIISFLCVFLFLFNIATHFLCLPLFFFLTMYYTLLAGVRVCMWTDSGCGENWPFRDLLNQTPLTSPVVCQSSGKCIRKHQHFVQEMMRLPLPEPAVVKAGCDKSICTASDWVFLSFNDFLYKKWNSFGYVI